MTEYKNITPEAKAEAAKKAKAEAAKKVEALKAKLAKMTEAEVEALKAAERSTYCDMLNINLGKGRHTKAEYVNALLPFTKDAAKAEKAAEPKAEKAKAEKTAEPKAEKAKAEKKTSRAEAKEAMIKRVDAWASKNDVTVKLYANYPHVRDIKVEGKTVFQLWISANGVRMCTRTKLIPEGVRPEGATIIKDGFDLSIPTFTDVEKDLTKYLGECVKSLKKAAESKAEKAKAEKKAEPKAEKTAEPKAEK